MASPERKSHRLSPTDGSFLSLLLFWILPFILINGILFCVLTAKPNFEVTVTDRGDYMNADITVKVKSHFPNDGIVATFNGQPLELSEQEKNVYSATVNENGPVEVSMTNKNGMNKILYETVACIDDTPPTFTESDSAAGFVSFFIDDAQSGVNFNSIYAIDSDGRRLLPSYIDQGESLVVFNFTTPTLEVHAFDNMGRESVISFGAGDAVNVLGNEEAPAEEASAETDSSEAGANE